MKLKVGPLEEKTLDDVLARMQKQSVHEIEVIGKEKKLILSQAIDKSLYVWAAQIGGKVACIWGLQVKNVMDDRAMIWMLSTELVLEHPFMIARHSKLFLETVRFNTIYGYVYKDFERSIRWLKWLGFTVRSSDNDVCYFELRRA